MEANNIYPDQSAPLEAAFLLLYVPFNNYLVMSEGFPVFPVLSSGQSVLLKDTTQ